MSRSNFSIRRIVSLLVFILLLVQVTSAQVRLPRLVSDSMILQRDEKVRLWGWASPGEKITVIHNRKKNKAVTGADGKWVTWLTPTKAGGPYTITVEGKNKITLQDVWFGDVFMCSGQSNMVHQMRLHEDLYAKDIAEANYPKIRQFWIATATDLVAPKDDYPSGSWIAANPATVREFSAVAYFFAKEIHTMYNVPVGIINASVGGTPVEAWTSERGLAAFPDQLEVIVKNKDTAFVNETNRRAAREAAMRPAPKDKGMAGVPWFNESTDITQWQTIQVPGYWEDQGIRDLDGIVWYAKDIDVPAQMTNIPALLELGRIVDADMVYINGKQVGNTTYQYPQRRYRLPSGILRSGKNRIVVRVTNNMAKGGFVPAKPYAISTENARIDLRGEWYFKVGDVFTPYALSPSIALGNQPAALFNAMIAPAVPYTIKGFVWYQGEANTNRAKAYRELMPALINDWRNLWQQNELPFIYVQLPGFMEKNYSPSESNWAMLREAQLQTLRVPNTGMAVAIDLGEWNDIHPGNKKDVGLRVAALAHKMIYGKNIIATGPLFKNATITGNRIIINFENAENGLVARVAPNDPLSAGQKLQYFAIAGADKKFVWADAVIEGNTVVVSSASIKEPVYVRYAWADNPEGANLYNTEGFPASPFRTDQ